jgi:hypothetical protein
LGSVNDDDDQALPAPEPDQSRPDRQGRTGGQGQHAGLLARRDTRRHRRPRSPHLGHLRHGQVLQAHAPASRGGDSGQSLLAPDVVAANAGAVGASPEPLGKGSGVIPPEENGQKNKNLPSIHLVCKDYIKMYACMCGSSFQMVPRDQSRGSRI